MRGGESRGGEGGEKERREGREGRVGAEWQEGSSLYVQHFRHSCLY